ncbi:hypothetical protein MRB53_032349 [Persea americana]|uniref:Uncharacterized protein n=1 Tax=Persea americana TaxID=3435 RepID=A0ACC2KS35_PERAE|nr:hypothetical protein MRB53_032349 [Persea americana]
MIGLTVDSQRKMETKKFSQGKGGPYRFWNSNRTEEVAEYSYSDSLLAAEKHRRFGFTQVDQKKRLDLGRLCYSHRRLRRRRDRSQKTSPPADSPSPRKKTTLRIRISHRRRRLPKNGLDLDVGLSEIE